MNEKLVPEYGLDYLELWKQRIREVENETGEKVKVRKNAVLAFDMILSFSKDTDIDLDKWKEYNIRWLKNTFGEKNIIVANLHLDEGTPHIHAIAVPIDENNHLCSKTFTGGRAKMFKLQDSYGRAMAPLGLQRGERFTRSKKTALYKFYSALNKASEEKLPPKEDEETYDDYFNRIQDYVRDLKISNLREQLKSKRNVEVAQARTIQFWEKYKDAVELQNTISENMDDDMELTRDRINKYINMEKAVPRKTLDKAIEAINNKYPKENSIRCFTRVSRRYNKRRKKRMLNMDIGSDEI